MDVNEITEKSDPLQALEAAVKKAGGQTALAVLIGATQPDIHYWLKISKKGTAAEYCRMIEHHTGIPCEELRPDVFYQVEDNDSAAA